MAREADADPSRRPLLARRGFLGAAGGVLGAVGLSAAGCGVKGSESAPTRLRLVATRRAGSAGGDGEEPWESLLRTFHQRHPGIRVAVTLLPGDQVSDEVARMVAEDEPPDIAQVPAYADHAAADRLHRVNELLTIPVLSDLVPGIAAAGEVGGVQYGMPLAASVGRLYYHRALFADAGLDPDEPPEDWADVLAAAEALRAAGVDTPFGLPLGHRDAHIEGLAWALSGGGAIVGPDGRYALDSAANARTFTWLRDELVGAGLTGDRHPAETTRADAWESFVAGTVGMLHGSTPLLGRLEETGVDFGTARIPGRRGPTPSPLGDALWLVAFRGPGHGEEVATFLNFLFAAENARQVAARHALLPVTAQATEAMEEREAAERESAPEGAGHGFSPFLEDLPTATYVPTHKVSWSRTAPLLAEGLREMVGPGADVPAVLARLQRRAEGFDEEAAGE